MDRLLTILANASQCASAVADWQAGRNVQAELEHHRFALAAERERNAHLERRVAELRDNRDSWMKAHDELADQVAKLREEVAMAKKPPPKMCPKCKGKMPCKCGVKK